MTSTTPHEWLKGILDKAEANGWTVMEVDMRLPGYVTLSDRHGTEVTIRSEHGIDLPWYVEQFKARPPTKATPFP